MTPARGPAAVRMPGEHELHEGTVMCWPVRTVIWGDRLAEAEATYARIAGVIAAHEPVWMVAPPERAEAAAARCGEGVTVVELPVDDSWSRDSGPIYVVDEAGRRHVLDPAFNAWGGKFHPYDDDVLLARRWAERRGEPVIDEPMVLEGGAVAVDGAGTLLTTEQCLLHPNRNPTMTRAAIEGVLCHRLGVDVVVWMPFGLVLDDDTDGHVDNVAAFCAPGRVLVQGCDDPTEADHARLAVNRRCLQDAPDARGEPLQTVEVPVLPFTELDGERLVVPYLNLYVCNGAVVVPTCGHPADADMLDLIGDQFPGRRVEPVPGALLAKGGGGPHCITQQIPAQQIPTGEEPRTWS